MGKNLRVWTVVFVGVFVAAIAVTSVVTATTGLNDAPTVTQVLAGTPIGLAVTATAHWTANRIARLPRFNKEN